VKGHCDLFSWMVHIYELNTHSGNPESAPCLIAMSSPLHSIRVSASFEKVGMAHNHAPIVLSRY